MYTYANKTQENKNQSVATHIAQKQGSGSTFQFVDNRPEAVAQRKLQEMANNSPQVKQATQLQVVADNYSGKLNQPIQLNKVGDDVSTSYGVTAKSDEEVGDFDETQKAMVHRGLVETEIHGDKKYVRAYQTIYAPNEDNSSWKDVHQEDAKDKEDQKIKFKGKGDTWVNFGQPLRALHYIRTYKAQADEGKREEAWKAVEQDERTPEKRKEIERAHGKPIVRSFLVPFDVYEELTSQAISESQRDKLGDYNMNVDKSKASDQYQIVGAGIKTMEQTAVPGSLVSYVLDQHKDEYQQPHHGEVKGVDELSEKLGLPSIFNPLTAPMEGTQVPSAETQAIRAKELGELYDLSFLVEKKEHHPQYAQSDISKHGYLDKYLNKEPEPRITELALKYLKTDTLPDTKEERDSLRLQLASAANASLIPQMIAENYEEGTAKMYADDRKDQSVRQAELKELYDLSFLVERKEHHPQYGQSDISKHGYLDKYLNKEPEPRIAELALKYLKTDTLPDTKEERDKLRIHLEASIKKSKERSEIKGEMKELSSWGKSQTFKDKKLASRQKPQPKPAEIPNQEEIERRREALGRNKEQTDDEPVDLSWLCL